MAQQQAHKDETYSILLRTSDRISGSTLQAPQWFCNFETVLPSCHTKYLVKVFLYGCPSTSNNVSNSDAILIHMSGISLNVYDSTVNGHSDVVGMCEMYTFPFTTGGNAEYGFRPHSRAIDSIVCTRPASQLVKITLTDIFDTAVTPAPGYVVLLQFSPLL